MPRVEQRTFGRFQIRGELGRGAYGVVLDAFDPAAGRPVALKMLRQGELASFENVERLRREAEALARVRHPNVVAVYESGARDGFIYVVLEPVSGRPLSEVMQAASLAMKLGALEQVARGLHAAHAVGVVHRDLKPANVLVDAEGRARIIDFGLARLSGASLVLTESGAAVGTPAYMAPEQARADGGAIGPWTDVYALGAMLFEVLTGHVPYAGARSPVEIAALLASATPSPRARDRERSVSRELDAVCTRALAKDPAERFPSAAAFADALREARRAGAGTNWTLIGSLLAATVVASSATLAAILAGRAPTPPPSPPPPPAPVAVISTRTGVAPAASATPRWFTLLPASERPPLPLPAGVRVAEEPGDFVNERDGSRLRFVPSGTFLMGHEGEDDREGPVHEVDLSGYFIGKLEVTVRQFAAFVAATHHRTSAEIRGSSRIMTAGGELEAPGACWKDSQGDGHATPPEEPVAHISWFDANAYCGWANVQLPSEAQWEKAAAWDPKTRNQRRYAWGDDMASAASPKVGNVLDEAFKRVFPHTLCFDGYDDGYVKAAPVGSFPDGASAYGALDMTGNVCEWCADAYDEHFYEKVGTRDPVCIQGTTQRIVRGGSFTYGPKTSRVTRRGVSDPETVAETLGFRIALPLR
jgi:formylglycine-generating enzyme required for sulfatase activity/predicted Ser/Thr protein kinase